eukprot:14359963-Alexandrium_andersonii.AAC.1
MRLHSPEHLVNLQVANRLGQAGVQWVSRKVAHGFDRALPIGQRLTYTDKRATSAAHVVQRLAT